MPRPIAVAILLASLSTVAFAAEERRDGNWWRSLGRADKSNYALGFMDGIRLGANFSYWGHLKDKGNAACVRKSIASYTEYESKYLANITNEQVVDGLDEFYTDYRNRRIKPVTAVWIVVNSIAGTPADQLNTLIENARRNGE